MVTVRARGEQAREFIISHVEKHPADIAKLTAEKFVITRQAVNRHLQLLVEEGVLLSTGSTRSRRYRLCPRVVVDQIYPVTDDLAEDVVWRNDIAPALGKLPANALDIWHYGFTEMFNNAIDHSSSKSIMVRVEKTAQSTRVQVADVGIGIFKKISDRVELT